ncbi:MAG: hypothetical protein ACXQS8_00910 [Candidatus Helarchaeales archaeon]
MLIVMTRYTTQLLYTFELIFSIAILSSCILVAFLKKDKVPLWVFLATSGFHTCVELWAEGVGIRVVETTLLFGVIPVSYPFTCIILGLFEGGLVGLSGLLCLRAILHRDKFSTYYFIAIAGAMFLLEIPGVIMIRRTLLVDPVALEITRRILFSSGALITLAVMYGFAMICILPWKKVPKKAKQGLLYWYLGLMIISVLMVIPLHVGGVRYIEIFTGTTYMRTNLALEILVMYGYTGAIESSGFFMAYYVPYYLLGWFEERSILQDGNPLEK